jgi:hypothetical protein
MIEQRHLGVQGVAQEALTHGGHGPRPVLSGRRLDRAAAGTGGGTQGLHAHPQEVRRAGDLQRGERGRRGEQHRGQPQCGGGGVHGQAEQTLLTGFQEKDGSRWGRPVMAVQGPNRALYMSDGLAGAVYRVTAS